MSSTKPQDYDEPPPAYHRRGSNHDLQVPMSATQRMSMEDEERPLPEGWIRQFDPTQAHHYYVDTKAKPPRSIWVHPYDDEQFQKEHGIKVPNPPSSPQATGQAEAGPSNLRIALPPQDSKLRKSAPASPTSPMSPTSPGGAGSNDKDKGKDKKRGFFGRLKDQAIGTKEEREEYKRKKAEADAEMERRYVERRRVLQEQQRQRDDLMRQYWTDRNNDPNSAFYRSGYQYNPNYAPPTAPYGRSRVGNYGYGGNGYGGNGFGGAGVGMGLLGGLAGGLLLGDILDGGFGGGGGFDGGFGGGGGFF